MDADHTSTSAMFEAAKQKYGRSIRVFETTSKSLSQQNNNVEEKDDFYKFTLGDYYRLISSGINDEKILKTSKIREAEKTAWRSKFTKAVIRVRFPNNHTLEVTFNPSERISALFEFIKKVLVRAELPFYLYTIPPKKRIKENTRQDFYAAGFVPGAIVYFSYELPVDDEVKNGSYFHEDLMALKEPVEELQVVQELKPVEKREACVCVQRRLYYSSAIVITILCSLLYYFLPFVFLRLKCNKF